MRYAVANKIISCVTIVVICGLCVPNDALAYPTLPISTAGNATVAYISVRDPVISPGDDVYITISEKNVIASPVTFPAGLEAWFMATLTIRDSHGAIVNSNIEREGGGGIFTGHMGFIEPGETYTTMGEKSSIWSRLADWGYRLEKPGKYSIVACAGYKGGSACSKPAQVTVSSPDPVTMAIKASLGKRADSKHIVVPDIVQNADLALASFTLTYPNGDGGGDCFLRKVTDAWNVVACGSTIDAHWLIDAGVPSSIADDLRSRLTNSEKAWHSPTLDAPSAPGDQWGVISGNMQFMITTSTPGFYVEDPLPITVQIKNLGQSVVIATPDSPDEYEVVNSGNSNEVPGITRLPSPRRAYPVWSTYRQFDQGAIHKVTIDLGEIYDFAPGSYKFRLVLKIRAGNLTVAQSNQPPIAILTSNPIDVFVWR
jgi:hypothetical protein